MQSIKITLKFLLALLISLTSSIKAEDQNSLKVRMVNDLEIIRNTFDVKYAPADWKKAYSGWDLNELISRSQIKILATDPIYVPDFQKIVKRFFKSTRDYHTTAHFYSTASAYLPFRVESAQGRYFIAWIDKEFAPSSLMIGDEVLTFAGIPISDAIEDLKALELGNVGSKTDQSLAEIFLTARIGSLGHVIPNGPISIVVKSNAIPNPEEEPCNSCGDFTVQQYDLEWDSTPEKITAGPYQMAYDTVMTSQTVTNTNTAFFHKTMQAGFYGAFESEVQQHSKNSKDAHDLMSLGNRESPMPPLGAVTWSSAEDSPFDAYIFATPDNHSSGYIRIPSYIGGKDDAVAFAELICRFESQTDALVIDQLNNPGGMIFYMYALASMLTPSSLELPTHRMTITQEDAFFAISGLKILESLSSGDTKGSEKLGLEDTIQGYPVTEELFQSLIKHFHFILKEWNCGRSFTSAAPLFGIEKLTRHPWASYSKPILFLVNQLDFSCGDFLPAILQDNKRAVIMGTKTAGAGGYVIFHSHPNRLGISGYSLTGSIAERLDNVPIENLGVTPDISCDLTPDDLLHHYVDYVKSVQSALDNLIKINQQDLDPINVWLPEIENTPSLELDPNLKVKCNSLTPIPGLTNSQHVGIEPILRMVNNFQSMSC